jgi:hypothetical protein
VKISIIFEYDTEHRVSRVLSLQPNPPFGLGEIESILHDSHCADDAQKELRRAVKAAIKGDLPSITGTRTWVR